MDWSNATFVGLRSAQPNLRGEAQQRKPAMLGFALLNPTYGR
jgi:hypothetical protein